ncbi:hypothetical protein [Comamonas thiooxydans]|uniref:hypothetical protein n=1 Tax=Comamonas thiooxydans TaxID=363952 RepID=UPI0012E8A71B|nr:hypothetical protein [Comamonas thiooxydans]
MMINENQGRKELSDHDTAHILGGAIQSVSVSQSWSTMASIPPLHIVLFLSSVATGTRPSREVVDAISKSGTADVFAMNKQSEALMREMGESLNAMDDGLVPSVCVDDVDRFNASILMALRKSFQK